MLNLAEQHECGLPGTPRDTPRSGWDDISFARPNASGLKATQRGLSPEQAIGSPEIDQQ